MPASHLRRAALLASLAGCAVAPQGPPASYTVPPAPARPRGEPTRILSAHAQPAAAGQRDYFGIPAYGLLYLVFSRPLDPAALAPGRFVTLADDGTRRVPIAARLAPASEKDELRALELVLAAPERRVLSVTVIGRLFDAEGHDVDGLSADVAAMNAAPAPVAAEHMSPGTACTGSPAVRVWWSVPVGAGPGPVRLVLRDGRVLAPDARADLPCAPAVRLAENGPACDVEDDNVIDYCTAAGDAVVRVELDPGAARDRQGVQSAGGRLDLP